MANTNSNEHTLSMNQDRGNPWIQFFLIILKICQQDSYDVIVNDTESNPLMLLCSHC